jgi:hypothetical protein
VRELVALALLFLSGCATYGPALRDERFTLVNHGNFTSTELQRVRAQLEVGVAALERCIGPIPARKFPVVVNLRPGRGVSHSYGGQGAIELYWVHERRAPIVHELTHVLAGYTSANGHWTQEGFASYMQDQYGEDEAFPTQKMAHALVKVIRREGSFLPMLDVMRDRARGKYFGLGTPWERWLAYTQSTSLTSYLIETYGVEKFLKIYDQPVEAVDFAGVYGKSVDALIDDWSRFVTELPGDTSAARAVYFSIRGGGRRLP